MRPACKFCGALKCVRYGRKNKASPQKWLCRNCRRTFIENNSLAKMKTNIKVIEFSLRKLQEGKTISQIQDTIFGTFQIHRSSSSISRWFNSKSMLNVHSYLRDVIQQNLNQSIEAIIKKGHENFLEHSANVWFWRKDKGLHRAKRLKVAPGILPAFYPFLNGAEAQTEGYHLTLEVDSLVPRTLPSGIRGDVIQEILLALLSGELQKEDISSRIADFIKLVTRGFQSRSIISLDRTLVGSSENLYLKDVLASPSEWYNEL